MQVLCAIDRRLHFKAWAAPIVARAGASRMHAADMAKRRALRAWMVARRTSWAQAVVADGTARRSRAKGFKRFVHGPAATAHSRPRPAAALTTPEDTLDA